MGPVKKINNTTCCVVNCKNTVRNSACKFYAFPKVKHKIQQREKWIEAVQRINSGNCLWFPKPWHLICSSHFINNKKSEEESSPSYVPTIFHNTDKVEVAKHKNKSAIERHDRFMKRRQFKIKMSNASTNIKKNIEKDPVVLESNDTVINAVEEQLHIQTKDAECDVNIYFHCTESSDFLTSVETTFVCNRYYLCGTYCDSETQTNIINCRSVLLQKQSVYETVSKEKKQCKSKKCGTAHISFIDKAVQFNVNDITASEKEKYFNGFECIERDEHLLDLAGVHIDTFQLLLKFIKDNVESEKNKLSVENRLLIFLMKMKTGMTFSALSVLFRVHRSSISRIFYSVLQILSHSTSNLVFWPDKDVIDGTMPQCFYPNYANTRVIIDCTEFTIEVPTSVDDRVFTYSHYKKKFTAKVLIGVTPGGFISFKSKVAGGRKSDSQMTVESGLIDLLEDGDVVLADKGFPEIRRTIDQTGKKVVLVMPPFLEKKNQFSKEETEETYNIARVRIHVERIMQRIRTYQILNKIPENLFHCIDDILHVCCALVNLQPPIIANNNDN